MLWLYPLHWACAWWERAAARNLHDINRTHDSKFGTEVCDSENPPTAQQLSHALHVQYIISLPCGCAGVSCNRQEQIFGLEWIRRAFEGIVVTAKWLRPTKGPVPVTDPVLINAVMTSLLVSIKVPSSPLHYLKISMCMRAYLNLNLSIFIEDTAVYWAFLIQQKPSCYQYCC